MINMFITDGMHLSFHSFFVLPRALYCFIWCRSRKLALNKINHLLLGLVLGKFCLFGHRYRGFFGTSKGMYSCPICPYIHVCVHISVCMPVHMSASTFAWPYNLLYIPWDIQGYIYVFVRHLGVYLFSYLLIHPAAVCRLTIIYWAY